MNHRLGLLVFLAAIPLSCKLASQPTFEGSIQVTHQVQSNINEPGTISLGHPTVQLVTEEATYTVSTSAGTEIVGLEVIYKAGPTHRYRVAGELDHGIIKASKIEYLGEG